MNMKTYDADIYELRKKGHKRPYKASEGRVYFHPHWSMTAPEYARVRKNIANWKAVLEDAYKVEFTSEADVYTKYVLLMLEHAVREIKINGTNANAVLKMTLPLPKSEWLVNKRKGNFGHGFVEADSNIAKKSVKKVKKS